ncbi:hypothetical protein XENTR_v10014236 [Xenopus tropicalis]|nr:hypothetical protein XENTR_v10014236 [Xenopus tropicalis]
MLLLLVFIINSNIIPVFSEIISKSVHPGNHITDTPPSKTSVKIPRISTIRRLFDVKRHRIKRSSVFPAGVKVCPQESLKQVLDSHLAYYKLRVCQEAVWEAYRIFLDRIPQTAEYQRWVDACQQESFCIFEIGKNFSSSQEHSEIIQQRVKYKTFTERKDEMITETTLSPAVIEDSSFSTNDLSMSLETLNDTLLNEIISDTKEPLKELEVTNLVPEQPVQQIVEFTVTLTNQEFTDEQRDPSSLQYQELTKSFQLQMEKVFEKLPGFKEIWVVGFRQKKENDGSDSIVVGYAVVFERSFDSKNNIDETPTITSNNVENGSIQEPKEMSYTVTELQNMVAMALRDDQSLPVDLHTLWFADDPEKSFGHLETDNESLVTIPPSKIKLLISEMGPSGDYEEDLSYSPPTSTYPASMFSEDSISPTVSLSASTIKTSAYIDSNDILSTTPSIGMQFEGPTIDNPNKSSQLTAAYEITSPPVAPVSSEVSDEKTLTTSPQIIIPNSSENNQHITSAYLQGDMATPPVTFTDIYNTNDPDAIELGFLTPVLTDHRTTIRSTDENEYSTEDISGDGSLFSLTSESSALEHSTTGSDATVNKGNELVVFFSLRVTNMPFSDDLFNKSSPEYKALEQQFLYLLLPYLQSNLTGFKEIEILNFKKGSVIVNSKLKFAKSVPYNVTKAVQCVLEDFCNAVQLLNLKIDSHSLDIEPADHADACKFMACDEFSECSINSRTKEAACLCKAGYKSLDGLPCQSVCELEPNYCADGQTCEIVKGQGAVCRSPEISFEPKLKTGV